MVIEYMVTFHAKLGPREYTSKFGFRCSKCGIKMIKEGENYCPKCGKHVRNQTVCEGFGNNFPLCCIGFYISIWGILWFILRKLQSYYLKMTNYDTSSCIFHLNKIAETYVNLTPEFAFIPCLFHTLLYFIRKKSNPK
jgi:hypothetical protein